jgi:hypothetical protein
MMSIPQPLQIKFNRGISVRGRSVVRSKGFEQKVVRAAGGAFNFNDNGLNANDINDDNSNNNVSSSARRAPSELLSPFFFFTSCADF